MSVDLGGGRSSKGKNVFESNDNVLSHVNRSGNGANGILVVAADRNRIVDGTFAGNPLAGLQIFFLQAEDGIRGPLVTGVQTCALPILGRENAASTCRSPAAASGRAGGSRS